MEGRRYRTNFQKHHEYHKSRNMGQLLRFQHDVYDRNVTDDGKEMNEFRPVNITKTEKLKDINTLFNEGKFKIVHRHRVELEALHSWRKHRQQTGVSSGELRPGG